MSCKRISKWQLLLPALWLCWSITFAQSVESGTLLYVDGKNITQRAHFELQRDDLIQFDAYGLAGGSVLHFQGKKGGLKFYEEDFSANARGEVKAVLFFPKTSSPITCTVSYTTKNGKDKRVKFSLEPAGSSRPGKRHSKIGISPPKE